ncbi:DUF1799 domain-containing protein [Desulfovibrio sp. OttesenSCG-928-A18]|nr:DUF1799 domain-containing protein [Desulfovibrio sp. OttesenSCG-928-A18]
MYENYGDEPPCATCYPGIHPWNETAFNVCWKWVKGQWRSAPSGVLAVDLCAIDIALRYCGIDEADKPRVAGQLLKIGEVVLAEFRRREEAQAKN